MTHQLERRCFRASAATGVIFIHHNHLLWRSSSDIDSSDCNQCLLPAKTNNTSVQLFAELWPLKVSEKQRWWWKCGGGAMQLAAFEPWMTQLVGELSANRANGGFFSASVFKRWQLLSPYPPQTPTSSCVSVGSVVLFLCFLLCFYASRWMQSFSTPVFSAENRMCVEQKKNNQHLAWEKKQNKTNPNFFACGFRTWIRHSFRPWRWLLAVGCPRWLCCCSSSSTCPSGGKTDEPSFS